MRYNPYTCRSVLLKVLCYDSYNSFTVDIWYQLSIITDLFDLSLCFILFLPMLFYMLFSFFGVSYACIDFGVFCTFALILSCVILSQVAYFTLIFCSSFFWY